MALLYCVNPRYLIQPISGSSFIADLNIFLLRDELLEAGDPIVIVASDPITKRGLTNRIVIHYVGESME